VTTVTRPSRNRHRDDCVTVHCYIDLLKGAPWGRLNGFEIEPYVAPVHLRTMRGSDTALQDHYFILPHELFHTMYKCGGDVWNIGMFGGPTSLAKYWNHEQHLPWFREVSEIVSFGDLSKAIPFGLHGDEVVDQTDGKVLVLTWNSVLSRAPSKQSRFVFTVVDHRRMDGRETLCELLDIMVWSLNAAATGFFPTHDHKGQHDSCTRHVKPEPCVVCSTSLNGDT
jgi:hypothetical protein